MALVPRQGLVKEFELTVLLSKSRSGSFGFTITRSKLDNCYYIQEILDNPAKADGRLRAGDRLVTVTRPPRLNELGGTASPVSVPPSGERTRRHQRGGRRRHDDPQVIAEAAEHDAGEGGHQPGGPGPLRQPA